MTDTGGRGTALRRFHANRLRRLPEPLRLPATFLWWVLAAGALIASIGGMWLGVVYSFEVEPRFDRIGLLVAVDDDNRVSVSAASRQALDQGLGAPHRIVAVNGQPIDPDIDQRALARRVDGPDGRILLGVAEDGKAARTVILARSPAIAAEAEGSVPNIIRFVLQFLVMAFACVWLVVAGALLMLRQRDDPVSALFATAFVLGSTALPVSSEFMTWAGMTDMNNWTTAGFFLVLASVLPAFPDGVYRPRWAGWMPLIAVLTAILIIGDWGPDIIEVTIAIVLVMVAAATPMLRYRRTPAGIERQQLKWAGLGFAASILSLAFAIAILVLVDHLSLSRTLMGYIGVVAISLFNLSFILLPAGLVISMLRFRLWRADAAIGRSALVAVLTLVAGAIWAASAELIDNLVADTMGADFTALSAAGSTVLAAGAIGPVGSRVAAWLDRRFRAKLLALRAIPDRLQIWQHADIPEEVGARISHAIRTALTAERVAVVLLEQGHRVIGADGVDTARVEAWLRARPSHDEPHGRPGRRSDPLFPVRMILDDGDEPIGMLLVGPHPDGSLYARDERNALATLEAPLAAALRQAGRRSREQETLAQVIHRLEARIDALVASAPISAG